MPLAPICSNATYLMCSADVPIRASHPGHKRSVSFLTPSYRLSTPLQPSEAARRVSEEGGAALATVLAFFGYLRRTSVGIGAFSP